MNIYKTICTYIMSEPSFLECLYDDTYVFMSSKLIKGCKTELDSVITYINSVICPMISINIDGEDKDKFILEAFSIVKNLSLIIKKHQQDRPVEYVNVITEDGWYADELKITGSSEYNNIFKDYKIISTVLTIIVKLVDFLNEYFLNNIAHMCLEEDINFEDILDLYDKGTCTRNIHIQISMFKNFYDNKCRIVHMYFISMFRDIYGSNRSGGPNGPVGLPIKVLDIFNSSLFFLQPDDRFCSFITKFERWLPSHIRNRYTISILKIPNMIPSLNPPLDLLVSDINDLYKKYLRNIHLTNDMCMNIIFLRVLLQKKNIAYLLSSVSFKDRQNLVSILLTIITKIKSVVQSIEIIKNALQCIDIIINHDNNIVKTYVGYQIIVISISLYEIETTLFYTPLDSIFNLLIRENTNALIYFSFQNKPVINLLSIVWHPDIKKLFKKISDEYEDLGENEVLLDPINSCCIVDPCAVKEHGEVKIYDKNVLLTWLFDSYVNPFTREELTPQMVHEFNETEEAKTAISQFNELKKSFVLK